MIQKPSSLVCLCEVVALIWEMKSKKYFPGVAVFIQLKKDITVAGT